MFMLLVPNAVRLFTAEKSNSLTDCRSFFTDNPAGPGHKLLANVYIRSRPTHCTVQYSPYRPIGDRLNVN